MTVEYMAIRDTIKKVSAWTGEKIDLNALVRVAESSEWITRTVIVCECERGERQYKTVFYKQRVLNMRFAEEDNLYAFSILGLETGSKFVFHSNWGCEAEVDVRSINRTVRFTTNIVFRDDVGE